MIPENQFKELYQSYKDSLDRQYQSAIQNLNQQKQNDYAAIMSGANKSGMLYSNFPQRSKIQYEAGTYLPNFAKLNTTYQTGLSDLRNNVLKYSNSIAEIQDAIANLNSMK